MIERQARFQRIYEDNYEHILGYALRRTETFDDAHDIVSDTFLAAWRRLDDVPQGTRARLWLYGTARKVLANHYRSRRRRQRLSKRLHGETVPAVDVIRFDTSGDVERIAAAFARLSAGDRELLLLSGWEELDAGQIAEVLGCERVSARVRLHRARTRFARQLAREGLQRSRSGGHEHTRWASTHPDAEETR
jgi:RNA polymerase sigma factor (sigma-70 family)